MDFGKSLDNATRYIHGHPLVGGAIVLALVVLLYLRPKLVFRFAVAAAIIVAVLYVGAFLINLTEIGMHEQDKLLDTPRINNMKEQ
jgi:hypothetical protein